MRSPAHSAPAPARRDPVALERAFQAMFAALDAPLLPAVKLDHVRRFLAQAPDSEAVEPYLWELGERLPALVRAVDAAGFDPDVLMTLSAQLRHRGEVASSEVVQSWLDEAADTLADRATMAYLYVGDVRAAFFAGMDRGTADGAVAPAWLWDDDVIGAPQPLGRLRRAVAAAQRRTHPDARRLRRALAAWEARLDRDACAGTLVVVTDERFEDGLLRRGVLRGVRVDLHDATAEEDDLVANVSCAEEAVLHRPMRVVRTLLAETHPLLVRRYVRGRVRFADAFALHEGQSAGLTLAALLYAALLRETDQRERVGLAPGVVATGALAAAGAVEPVDEETLPAKVKAVFFSPLQTLAVPHAQLDAAREALAPLHERFPHRHLELVGVSHLKDLFFDRRLSVIEHVHPVRHALSRVWHWRYGTALAVLALLAVLLAGRLVYGPFDDTPAGLRYDGAQLLVLNAAGETLDAVEAFVGGVPERAASGGAVDNQALLIDVDGDGREELVWRVAVAGAAGDLLRCKTVGQDMLQWEARPRFAFHYPQKSDIQGRDPSDISIAGIAGDDIDQDGEAELYVVGAMPGLFPAVLARYDAVSGERVSAYHHAGYLNDVLTADLDGDGRREVVALGKNQAYREAALVVLDARFIQGHGPTQGSYQTDTYGAGMERAYVRLPVTKVGEAFRYATRGSSGKSLDLMPSGSPLIGARIVEVDDRAMRQVDGVIMTEEDIYTTVYFGPDLEPSHVATSDPFDFLAEYLYDRGFLDELPDKAYFDDYLTTLRWWDGEAWQDQRVENKYWREAAAVLERATEGVVAAGR